MQTTKTKRVKKTKTRVPPRTPVIAKPKLELRIPRPDVLHSYLEYGQINQYLDYIASRYSNFVKLHTLGTTHEKREVRAVEINWMNEDNSELSSTLRVQAAKQSELFRSSGSKGPMVLPGENNRNVIFIEAGTHAREWITVSTCLNCIYQLTERYTRNIEVLRKLRFIIVPLVNPDGYEYSRTKVREVTFFLTVSCFTIGIMTNTSNISIVYQLPLLCLIFAQKLPYLHTTRLTISCFFRIPTGARTDARKEAQKSWVPTAIATMTSIGSWVQTKQVAIHTKGKSPFRSRRRAPCAISLPIWHPTYSSFCPYTRTDRALCIPGAIAENRRNIGVNFIPWRQRDALQLKPTTDAYIAPDLLVA